MGYSPAYRTVKNVKATVPAYDMAVNNYIDISSIIPSNGKMVTVNDVRDAISKSNNFYITLRAYTNFIGKSTLHTIDYDQQDFATWYASL
jgi:hypothetical protein